MNAESRARMLDAIDRAIAANRSIRGEVQVLGEDGRVLEVVLFADREPDLLALRQRYETASCADDPLTLDAKGPDDGSMVH